MRIYPQVGNPNILLPPTYWAVGGVPFSYTLRIPSQVLEAILAQLFQAGFACAVIVAGHYGIDRYTALKRAALQAMGRGGLAVLALADFELVTNLGRQAHDHAGVVETSLQWAIWPNLVAMDHAPSSGPFAGILSEDPPTGASQACGQSLLEPLWNGRRRFPHSYFRTLDLRRAMRSPPP